jgi:pilus assembly protein Flp/PilA
MLFPTPGSRRCPAEVLIMNPIQGEEHGPRGEQGQGMVEYALILALIALVTILALGLLGSEVTGFFQELVDFLNSI